MKKKENILSLIQDSRSFIKENKPDMAFYCLNKIEQYINDEE